MLLKLSGETFGGGKVGVDADIVRGIAEQLAEVVAKGTQVAVVGKGFFRGAELSQAGMDRTKADYMGMLGTVMNCLALQDFCEKAARDPRPVGHHDGAGRRALHPAQGHPAPGEGPLVIFGAGAGMPYFSTDTVAAQRALEIECQVLLMGKNGVDGVYDDDPRTNPAAVMYDDLTTPRCSPSSSRWPTPRRSACAWTTPCRSSSSTCCATATSPAVAGERIGTLISQPS